MMYGSIIYVLTGGLMFFCLRLSHTSQWFQRTVFFLRIPVKLAVIHEKGGGGAQIDGGK